MNVGQLKRILERLDDSCEVVIEHEVVGIVKLLYAVTEGRFWVDSSGREHFSSDEAHAATGDPAILLSTRPAIS